MEPEVLQNETHAAPKKRRVDAGIRALAEFVKALEAEPPDAQRATIFWLADRFLGMTPRDFRKTP
jgi:hypothetical protein